MWFCDHSEWWFGWIVGGVSHLFFDLSGWSSGHLSSGSWFGFVVSDFLFTYVCMNLPQGKKRMLAPPTVRSLESRSP